MILLRPHDQDEAMTDVEQLVFDAMSKTLFIDEAAFKDIIKGWQLCPEHKDGELFAVVLMKGPEFHFVSTQKHAITRADIRRHLKPLIEQYGYAQTRAPKKDTRQRRFNLLLGFQQVGEDELDYIYRIESLKEAPKCQQQQS
jgi:hypothetical protein